MRAMMRIVRASRACTPLCAYRCPAADVGLFSRLSAPRHSIGRDTHVCRGLRSREPPPGACGVSGWLGVVYGMPGRLKNSGPEVFWPKSCCLCEFAEDSGRNDFDFWNNNQHMRDLRIRERNEYGLVEYR